MRLQIQLVVRQEFLQAHLKVMKEAEIMEHQKESAENKRRHSQMQGVNPTKNAHQSEVEPIDPSQIQVYTSKLNNVKPRKSKHFSPHD